MCVCVCVCVLPVLLGYMVGCLETILKQLSSADIEGLTFPMLLSKFENY